MGSPRSGLPSSWALLARPFRRGRFDASIRVLRGDAEEPLVLGGQRKLLVGDHLRAHDAPVVLRVVDILRSVAGGVEVADDTVRKFDLVQGHAVDRHGPGDLGAALRELLTNDREWVDQGRRGGIRGMW